MGKPDQAESLKRFRNYLSEEGYRLTQERERIAETVFSSDRRFEAEELLYEIRREGKSVSRATIYRTLELLVDSGEVRKLDFGDGYSVYEVQGEDSPDGHMYCQQCGKVIEFNSDQIESIFAQVSDENDFHVERTSTKIFGYCSDCWKVVNSDDS